ncbi:MAG: hypothetical protein ACKO7N_08800, partial [Candidatus Nitrosotenuis sp.]
RQNAELRFWEKVSNFPKNLYKIDDRNSHIFNLMYSILENGVGQVKGMIDLANQSQNSLAGTEGPELDKFFQTFGIKRDSEFIYKGNIASSLDFNDIQEFKSMDSKFRIAIAKMLQAIQKGGTPEGLRLMAEATSSYSVQVIEPWQIDTNQARLIKEDNTPAINEVVIVILPDKILTDSESESLKAKLISNLEIIRPYGVLLTIKIINPLSDNELIIPDYAISGQFVFLSDGSNQYVELLSREKEININSFVIDANSFEIDSEYSTLIGKVVDDLDDILIVNQSVNPFAPVFLALITNDTQSEIVLVYNQLAYQQNGQTLLMYEVARARLGTSKINWATASGEVKVYVNLIKTNIIVDPEDDMVSAALPIPTADSPDNYPEGKAADDPTKYDSNGDYSF